MKVLYHYDSDKINSAQLKSQWETSDQYLSRSLWNAGSEFSFLNENGLLLNFL